MLLLFILLRHSSHYLCLKHCNKKTNQMKKSQQKHKKWIAFSFALVHCIHGLCRCYYFFFWKKKKKHKTHTWLLNGFYVVLCCMIAIGKQLSHIIDNYSSMNALKMLIPLSLYVSIRWHLILVLTACSFYSFIVFAVLSIFFNFLFFFIIIVPLIHLLLLFSILFAFYFLLLEN